MTSYSSCGAFYEPNVERAVGSIELKVWDWFRLRRARMKKQLYLLESAPPCGSEVYDELLRWAQQVRLNEHTSALVDAS